MNDPYLIAHIVRGEPAFDIATQMTCPECDHGTCYAETAEGTWEEWACSECDGEGFWWIIPTSGHRAYPYQYWALDELHWSPTTNDPKIPITDAAEAIMAKLAVANWPDHYPHSASPKAPKIDLVSALGLRKPIQIKRRF